MSEGDAASAAGPSLAGFYAARLDEDEAAAKAWPDIRPQMAVHDLLTIEGPARVLREVAAGRAILAAYEAVTVECATMLGDRRPRKYGEWDGLHLAVQHLAAVHSDHPGYRDEWKP